MTDVPSNAIRWRDPVFDQAYACAFETVIEGYTRQCPNCGLAESRFMGDPCDALVRKVSFFLPIDAPPLFP